MVITTEQQALILKLVQAIFNATPGAIYLQALGTQVTAGKPVADLAQLMLGTNFFIGKVYNDSVPGAFASAFVEDVIGDRAADEDKAWVIDYINNKVAAGATQDDLIDELIQALLAVPASDPTWGEAALHFVTDTVNKVVGNLGSDLAADSDKALAVDYMLSQIASGQNVGAAIEWAVNALDGIDYSDPAWGKAAALFDNRFEVSSYYSIDKMGSTTNFSIMKQLLSRVTVDQASVAGGKNQIDQLLKGTIPFVGLNGNNGFRLDGVAQADETGYSVSSAGDINGDGYDDVIIAAHYAAPNGITDAGSSYVVFGKSSGFDATLALSSLDGANGFRLDGVAVNDYSGDSVSGAGDVNGDGFSDVIIGAPLTDLNGINSGSSYIVFGKASGFPAATTLSNLDGNTGFRLDGLAERNNLGTSVSGAGDVNGDGFDDVIVEAAGASPNGNYSGSSYVVFGKASGFSATLDLADLNGSNGFRLDGGGENSLSGSSVSSAGDVNGDGFTDLIVAASRADFNGSKSGSSYVIFGKVSGFDAILNLSSLDGNNGFRLDGVAEGDYFGSSISGAGDINGDGFDDVIIGASGRVNSNGDESGSSYVIFGKASKFSAVLDLSSLNGSNGFRLDGMLQGDGSGRSVSSAGDFNADGFDDLIVTTERSNPNANGPGAAFVVLGKSSDFAPVISMSDFYDNNDLITLNGLAPDARYGVIVSDAGDVNGDGFGDVMVGTPSAAKYGYSTGSSYVVLGGNVTNEVTFLGTSSADSFTNGTSKAEYFAAGDGNDVMTGGGGADVFYGGAGDDMIQISDLDFMSIDGGSGNDTLEMVGDDLELNLTNFRNKISGIETINVTGNGNNALNLTSLDLLNLSHTTNALIVEGNAGDRIIMLNDGWIDGGTQGLYHTYTNGGAALLVGVNLTIDFG